MTWSPGCQASPFATMLIASVASRVKTTSPSFAPMNRFTFWWASQYFCEAIWERRCIPLPTFAR